jgi:thiol:disulfide interchange protein DsbA
MNRRDVLQQLGVLAFLSSPARFALAQDKESFRVLSPAQPSDVKGKIEVLEFFHYGCPHCRNFDPLVAQWLKNLPSDVVFTRVPVIWGDNKLRALASLYYALKVVKQLDKLHGEIFIAVQNERLNFADEDVLRDWVGKRGVDVKSFMDAYTSFGVQAQTRRAEQLAKTYKVDGVPTMAVAGRFVTSTSLAGERKATEREQHASVLKVVDSLIERARKPG